MDHEEHFFTMVKWRVAVPSVQGDHLVNRRVGSYFHMTFRWFEVTKAREIECVSYFRSRRDELSDQVSGASAMKMNDTGYDDWQ